MWLAVTAGVVAAGQSRVNASLGERIGSSLAASLISFGSGLLLVTALVLAVPAMRRSLLGLRSWDLPGWQYFGGLGGAFFVLVAAFGVPQLGVALLTVALVAGQTAGGLAVDWSSLSLSGRRRVTGPRLAGAVLGVLAVTVAGFDRLGDRTALLPLFLAVLAGAGLSVQAGINARLSRAAGQPVAATVVNFVVGTVALLLVAVVVAAFGGLQLGHPPPDWWLYLGGLCGIGFVVAAMVCVPVLGVLRMGLASVVGQLCGAVVLDALVPGGPPVSIAVIAGAALTVVAVWVTGMRRPTAPG
jgi:transporter family-2 protein